MCLNRAKKVCWEPWTKEIKCLKILKRTGDSFISPYYKKEYMEGEVVEATGETEVAIDDNQDFYVNGGFLHTYRDIWKTVYELCGLSYSLPGEKFVIAECCIPWGVTTYEGKVNNWPDIAGYASRSLKIGRFVPKEEACKYAEDAFSLKGNIDVFYNDFINAYDEGEKVKCVY